MKDKREESFAGSPPGPATVGTLPKKKSIGLMEAEHRLQSIPMQRATVFSVALHVVGPIVLGLLTLLVLLILSWLMHFNFWDLFKPHAAKPDLEFTLVKDTHVQRPDHPLFRGNFNQRAGGKRNPKQPVRAVEDPPASPARKAASTAPKTPSPQPQQTAPKKPPKNTETVTKPDAKPVPFKPTIATSKAPVMPSDSDSKETSLPDATSGTPDGTQTGVAQGIVGGTGAGTGTVGNAQGGPGGPGVDVAADPDFGPFMADLTRRIKRNWMPPRNSERRVVQLLFYLARDGRVVKIETKETSGDEETDRAAIAAVEASAPFRQFPPGVREDILPIEFTFDYNVLNPKNTKRGLW